MPAPLWAPYRQPLPQRESKMERDRKRLEEMERNAPKIQEPVRRVRTPAERKRELEALESRFRRTPAQQLADLRRHFGDERRDPRIWDTLPDPLYRHWLKLRDHVGERLSDLERRVLSTPVVEGRITAWYTNGKKPATTGCPEWPYSDEEA